MADMPFEEVLNNALQLDSAELARFIALVASELHARLESTDADTTPALTKD
jgi:hypothetical protein